MNWFAKVVKTELERRNWKVTEMGHSTFKFSSENVNGKIAGIYCKSHGHINTPMKRKLFNLAHRLGFDSVYVASEAYSDLKRHVVKIVEIK